MLSVFYIFLPPRANANIKQSFTMTYMDKEEFLMDKAQLELNNYDWVREIATAAGATIPGAEGYGEGDVRMHLDLESIQLTCCEGALPEECLDYSATHLEYGVRDGKIVFMKIDEEEEIEDIIFNAAHHLSPFSFAISLFFFYTLFA